MSRQLKNFAAYALWGLAATGVLAAVLYVALARSGEASNPADIALPGQVEIGTPIPVQPTPTPDSFLTDGGIGASSGNNNREVGSKEQSDAVSIPVMLAKAQRHNGVTNSFSVALSWTAIDGAVRYDVERDSGDGYVSLGWIEALLVSETLVTDARLKPHYRVRACTDDAGQVCGKWSAPAAAELRPLTAPTEVRAEVTGELQTFTISLSWATDGAGRYHASRGEDMDYRVERDTGAGWVMVTSVAVEKSGNPAYTDTLTRREPVTAQYRVSLCAPDVCGPATVSNRLELTPLLSPATPTGFSGYYDGPLNSRVQRPEGTNLSWDAPTARHHRGGRIEVQRRRAGASWGHLTNLAWAAGDNPPTSHVDEVVSSGNSIQVQYRIRACNPAGCSDWSNTVEVTVQRSGKVTF